MEDNIADSYKTLLSFICDDKKHITLILNCLQSSGNSRRSRSGIDAKAIANVISALKSGHIGMAINILKNKTNKTISDKFLTIIGDTYGCSQKATENLPIAEIVDTITDENAPGYLAHYIIQENIEVCTNIKERLISEISRMETEKSISLEEAKIQTENIINQKKIQKLKKENEKLKSMILEYKKKIKEKEIGSNEFKEQIVVDEKKQIELTSKNNELQKKVQYLENGNHDLELNILELKKQISELVEKTNSSENRMQDVYFYGQNRGLIENEKYNFIVVPSEAYHQFRKHVENGENVWVILIEIPFSLKLIIKPLQDRPNVRIFETKSEMYKFLG